MTMILTRLVMKTVMLVEIRNNIVCAQTVLNHSVKHCSRWAHRNPSKVYVQDSEKEITEEHYENDVKPKYSKKEIAQPVVHAANEDTDTSELQHKSDYVKTKGGKSIQNCKRETYNEPGLGESDDTGRGTQYTKLYRQADTTLSQLMLKVKSRKTRDKSGLMVLEGKRLNQDALIAGLTPECLFFRSKADIQGLKMPADCIKLYQVPYKQLQLWSDLTTSPGLTGFYKISSGHKIEPANNSLPLTVICDNVREPGNMGAIIRIAAGVGCRKLLLTKGCVDVWDSKVLRAGVGAHFRIPIEQDVEWNSINQHLNEKNSIFIADNTQEGEREDELLSSLPLIPYYSVRYGELASLVVIIGGETEGISKDALFFARYLNGARVNIPLSNSVESLNTGSALSIILFEIRRQLLVDKNSILSMSSSN